MREEKMLEIINELTVHAALVELENDRLRKQNERKDKTIQQLVELCNKWYAELKQYETNASYQWRW
ncbi:hypothetical protein [Mahella australiensis]|uniref:DNA-directed RNA polymerase, omega subunit family protein n=1 Tax=Mahella australiensis (strain DSM 15567 / CIP 107919 / 50-1 BON) TaxID=697281 RepID=F3ZZF0_MAHA5|nr:hypothetical protein [Mahella australiensis]AEE95760.1 DNA-directed RNA polymerase, omega subunit family protein [Mahella australiensis 50-1 BON]